MEKHKESIGENRQNAIPNAKTSGSRTPNVPALRFPGFTEEWEEHYLAEYLDFKNGLNPNANKFGSGIKFISVMDILNNDFITYDCIRTSVKITPEEQVAFAVEKGDMLFQRSSETLEDVGRANVYMDDQPAVFGGFVIRGKKKTEYNPMFFRYLLASPYARKKIIPMGAGAQHFNIGQDGLSKVRLHFPVLQEQHKIATLLRLIDDRISTQNKIIEDLKKLKSAITEILFCTPKESMPSKRLSVYKNEWKLVRLSDICQRIRTKNVGGQCRQVLTIAAQYGLVNQEDFFNKTVASENLEGYYLLQKGDFAYNKSYSGDYTWGAIKRLGLYEQGVLSPLYICFRPDITKVDADYLAHYFESKKWYKGIADIAGEGARNHGLLNISVIDFFDTIHRIPDLKEQKVIAQFLNMFSSKLSCEQRIMQSLTKQRNYLLQKMFI